MLVNVIEFFAILYCLMGVIMLLPYHFGGRKRSAKYCLAVSALFLLGAIHWGFMSGAQCSSLHWWLLGYFLLALANAAIAMRVAYQAAYFATEP